MRATGTLDGLPGVGKVTALVDRGGARRGDPDLPAAAGGHRGQPLDEATAALRARSAATCTRHSDWSDGGSPIREMAEAAIGLGHEYMALTDHSPRLTVANGLSAERLRAQLDVVAELNEELAPFRILTGIEGDILDDGSLDQDPELLAGSTWSSPACTPSCGCRGRDDPPDAARPSPTRTSTSSATAPAGSSRPAAGAAAAAGVGVRRRAGLRRLRRHDVAVEINSRPERLDPPKRLLRAGRRGGLQVRDRHRRARARSARLAAVRLRARRPVRRRPGARRQHAGRAEDLLAWARK